MLLPVKHFRGQPSDLASGSYAGPDPGVGRGIAFHPVIEILGECSTINEHFSDEGQGNGSLFRKNHLFNSHGSPISGKLQCFRLIERNRLT